MLKDFRTLTFDNLLIRTAIDASAFGFDAINGTAANNAQAIMDAVAYAAGRKVTVQVPVDWECGVITTSNMDTVVEFIGDGRVQWDVNGSGRWIIDGEYTNIQSVSSLTNVSVSIGGASTNAMAMVVPDASLYTRGDVCRIVSDDLYTEAPDDYTARQGEDFTVIHVDTDTDTVYAAGVFEFQANYVTNIRIGKLEKYKIDIRNLRILGGRDDLVLLTVGPHWRPHIEAKMEGLAYIGFTSRGNIEGEFVGIEAGHVITGDFDDLTYGVFEISGARNKYHDLKGFGCRHVFTDIINSVDADSDDLAAYGPPRDNEVLFGISVSGTNAPWDTHAGSHRMRFTNCQAILGQRGSGASHAAFQARGSDMMIINPFVDTSYNIMLYNSPLTPVGTTVKVIGGECQCPVLATDENVVDARGDVYITSLQQKTTSNHPSATFPFVVVGFNLTIDGGSYEFYQSGTSRRVFQVVAGRVFLKGEPYINLTGTVQTWRFANLLTASRVSGECRLALNHIRSGTSRMFRLDTDSDTGSFNVRVLLTAGTVPTWTEVAAGASFTESVWELWDDSDGLLRVITTGTS